MVQVRKRTIPTELPPLVGEVIINFCGQRVPRGQRDGFIWPYSRFSRQEPLLFYQVAPQLYSQGRVHPVSDPLIYFLAVPVVFLSVLTITKLLLPQFQPECNANRFYKTPQYILTHKSIQWALCYFMLAGRQHDAS
jgi:hypothetical protein